MAELTLSDGKRRAAGGSSQDSGFEGGTAAEMLWYVIQTYTGREEKLVEMIRRIIPGGLYGDCFVAYHEQLRRRQQENRVHVERSFPGYAFITTDDPDELFFHLKKVPAMSKLLTAGEFYFTPVAEAEAGLMERVTDRNHVIRLSYVATDGCGHVSWISGPLKACGGRTVTYQFRKRYASVRLELAGKEKEMRMGIILNDDIRREVSYGKVEAPIAVPDKYRVAEPEEKREAEQPDGERTCFRPGDSVLVISGVFEGVPAVVCRAGKGTVRIGVHLFGRDMTAEVPVESVRKTA